VADDHSGCAQVLIDMAADLGTRIEVLTERPAAAGPHPPESFICPHGVTLWIRPTADQVAQWVRDGVE